MELEQHDLTPLSAAAAALIEQADRAMIGGDWSAAGSLLEDAGELCHMIHRRQVEDEKRLGQTA